MKLPWKIDKYGTPIEADGRTVEANGFATICSSGKHQDAARATTAFIVHACNNHYQLLEALKAAEICIDALVTGYDNVTPETFIQLERIRAALKSLEQR